MFGVAAVQTDMYYCGQYKLKQSFVPLQGINRKLIFSETLEGSLDKEQLDWVWVPLHTCAYPPVFDGCGRN